MNYYCCVSPKKIPPAPSSETALLANVHHMGGREARAVLYQPQSREFRILWPMLTGQRQDFLCTKDSTQVNW